MQHYLIYFAVLLTIIIFVPFYRVVTGPTLYDRMLCAGSIATNSMVIILLVGVIFNRLDMFVDITMAYAGLNFIGTIAFAKYLGSTLKSKKKDGN
ncbi:MAG: monovalent cation/H+ antiporter complex subunit F [Acidobacteriota bacterium]|jgi:multicomponent Na+:H+ antiporter subunit F|nr:monovalent cation/H+ antiporter complex subunit F [Acidobacteriota bacterium]